MGGKNPYIEETKFTPATKKYKVTFVKEGKTVEIDPDKVPYGHDGSAGQHPGYFAGLSHGPGSCLRRSVRVFDVPRDRARGSRSCNEATDAELDQLDEAPGVTPKSRLGCQCVPDGTKDIVVEIPEWNKNYAKEAEH